MAQLHLTPQHINLLKARGVDLSSVRGQLPFDGSASFEPPVAITAEISLSHAFKIGAFSHLNGGFIQNVAIGRYCSFARDVQIGHGMHPLDWLSVSPQQYVKDYRGWSRFLNGQGIETCEQPIGFTYGITTTIGNDVWIGNQVFIKDGVTIGDGCIIGAGSVVTKDIPPYMVAAGNPARVLRARFDDKLIEQLTLLRWWRFALCSIPNMPFDQPALAVEYLSGLIANKSIQEYRPEPITLPEFFANAEPTE